MRITITPQQGGAAPQQATPFLLCDDALGVGGFDGPTSSWLNGCGGQCKDGYNTEESRATEATDLIGAEFKQETPRGNRQYTMTFTVQRTFSTPDFALMFIADHPDLVPDSGTVQVVIGNTSRYLKNAVVKSVRCSDYCNLSFNTTYTVSGSFIPPVYGAAGSGTGGPWTAS